jgi:hypothetical protein
LNKTVPEGGHVVSHGGDDPHSCDDDATMTHS